MRLHRVLLTQGELARAIGCHPRTVKRWRQAGLIPAVPLRSGYRYILEDVLLAVGADDGDYDADVLAARIAARPV